MPRHCGKGPGTSTPSRSTRSSTSSGAAIIPTGPTATRRVTVHLDDGRSFVRKTERQYDLIVYALVDSLALHSSYSSVRLESFLFTEEAFRDVKAKLKPGGVFAMYNYYRQGWVVGRLANAGRDRLRRRADRRLDALSGDDHAPDDNQRGHITFLLVGDAGTKVVDAIRSKFARDRFVLAQSPASLQRAGQRLRAGAAARRSQGPYQRRRNPRCSRSSA